MLFLPGLIFDLSYNIQDIEGKTKRENRMKIKEKLKKTKGLAAKNVPMGDLFTPTKGGRK